MSLKKQVTVDKREKPSLTLFVFFVIVLFVICALPGCKENSNEPPIPDGFEHKEGSVKEGFVIADEDGNEFVWVPEAKAFRYDYKNDKEVGDEVIDSIYYGEGRKESVTHGTDSDISHFKDSVKEYGGFYISRYEAGKEDGGELASKKELPVYSFVTRDDALKLSENFYKGDDAKSVLISSYAWDMTMKFIGDKKIDDISTRAKEFKGKLNNTGSNEDVLNNIHDLAGNVTEWTTEYSSNAYYEYHDDCVSRGSTYDEESMNPRVRKYNSNTKNEFTGFRIVIYMQ